MFKISKENKKLIFGIILAAVVFLSYQVIASYMTNPVDTTLKYPNPGHYPGEIGPGTFNSSNTLNPYWSFPDSSGDRFTGLEIRNGSGQFYKTLQVFNNFYTYANTYLGNDSSDKTIVKGNLEVSGKGNFYELCIQGNCTTVWPIGGGGGTGEITFDVWTGSDSDGCSSGTTGIPCSVTCNVTIPDGYTVIYAHGGKGGHPVAQTCQYPSHEESNEFHTYGVACEEISSCIGKVGPSKCKINISSAPYETGTGWYNIDAYCGIYVIAVKATGVGGGAVEDKWVNETGDTMTGDLNVTGGIVVGNPDEGNKGPGTINAEKIYVNGSEIGGGGSCPKPFIILDPSSCNPSIPGDCTCSGQCKNNGYSCVFAQNMWSDLGEIVSCSVDIMAPGVDIHCICCDE